MDQQNAADVAVNTALHPNIVEGSSECVQMNVFTRYPRQRLYHGGRLNHGWSLHPTVRKHVFSGAEGAPTSEDFVLNRTANDQK